MVRVAALSDIGCRRSNNEDSFGYDETCGLYVVSDGMGGSAAGEVASHITVTTVLSSFREMVKNQSPQQSPVQHLLYYAVIKANAAVFQQSQSDVRCAGMGATLVALCVDGPNAIIANVGDSRAYLIRGDSCTAITRDHSLGAEQALLCPDNPPLPADPSYNIITRAIGVERDVKPDLYAAQMVAGDRLLLASDGLMKHMEDVEIGRVMLGYADLELGCAALVETVKARGATDNVTCLVVEAG